MPIITDSQLKAFMEAAHKLGTTPVVALQQRKFIVAP
jgi:hypothetical protein